jgi:hypothetical protein
MAKSDLDSMSIEELAVLRDNANAKLLAVAAHQLELEAEMDRLSQYGKPAKKALSAPAAPAPVKPKKGDEASGPSVAEAA